MATEFEKKNRFSQLIKQETRLTMRISLFIQASILVYTLLAFLLKNKPLLPMKTMASIWSVFNVITVLIVILVLALRKSVYFSAKLLPAPGDVVGLLRNWRSIDLTLLGLGESIGIFGLIMAVLGMPFKQTFHFFVGAFLLNMIIMPIAWKVMDKIDYFQKYSGSLDEQP